MLRYLLPLLAVLLLAGCAALQLPGQRSCDQLSGKALREWFGTEMTPDELASRIANYARISPAGVGRRSDEDRWNLDWQTGGVSYTAGWSEGKLLFLNMRYEEPQPSIGRVIGCLGTPSRYQAWYDLYPTMNSEQSSFIFSTQAAIAYGTRHMPAASQTPPPIDGTFPVSMISIFESGWTDADWERGKSRPWPGKWEELEIEVIRH